jgi:hypothetical protein
MRNFSDDDDEIVRDGGKVTVRMVAMDVLDSMRREIVPPAPTR